ncbi:MAG: flavin reductase family protein [Eubacteriales bacterium]
MFHTINPKELAKNPFSLFDDAWPLITAGTQESCNTMTASWGGLGILWNLPMATIYVRPQRYTKEFLDREEYFSLSFLGDPHRKNLSYCGTISGRDQDKIAHCGYTTLFDHAPYFAEADMVMICRKRFTQPLNGSAIPEEIVDQVYPDKDFHHLYFGEILQVLAKDIPQ